MPLDFDQYPLYDAIVGRDGRHLSDTWNLFLAADRQNLSQFLTSTTVNLPNVTTAQRDQLKNLKNGLMIYNTDVDSAQLYKESSNTWVNFP